MRVIVIGSGLLGVACAYYLRRGGAEVVVVDRAEGPGLGASYANGAMLHASLAHPWNAPGVAGQLMRSVGHSDATLIVRARALMTLPKWGLRFLKESSPERHHRNTLANLRLALWTRTLMQQLRAEENLRYGQQFKGVTMIFRDTNAFSAGEADALAFQAEGVRSQRLDTAALLTLEPALAPVAQDLAGAIHYPDDEGGDAYRFCGELVRVCRAAGVEFKFRTTVGALELRRGRINGIQVEGRWIDGDAIVVAAGFASEKLARPLGLRLPVRPVKGYSITFARQPHVLAPSIPVVDYALHAAVVPVGEDRLRIVGTAEFAGEDLSLHPARMTRLHTLLERLYPHIASALTEADLSPWAGLRPMCADGVPLLGRTPIDGLWLCTGHGHLGWTLAAGSGERVAAALLGRPGGLNIGRYELSRFG